MSLNCTVLQASKLVSRNTDEHTACLLALLTVLNWCGAIQHNAHGPRSPRSGAAPVFIISRYGSWENNQSLHENNQKWYHTTF